MSSSRLSYIVVSLIAAYITILVLLFILRLVTGLSIQRIGITSLRRISYSPKHGIKVEIRSLGFKLHRPTFAQPTWISLVVTELRVSLDLEALGSAEKQDFSNHNSESNGTTEPNGITRSATLPPGKAKLAQKRKRELFARLLRIKDKIKKLHRILPWIKWVDLVMHRSAFVISDIGTLELGFLHVSVDTRPVTVDRSRLFQHNRKKSHKERPAEWTFGMRSILFSPVGNENKPSEILDHCVLNIHGFLYEDVEGLREASLFLKLGRLNIPLDDFLDGFNKVKQFRPSKEIHDSHSQSSGYGTEAQKPLVQQDQLLSAVLDAQGFVASVLRGIREITVATSFVGLSKRVDSVKPAGGSLFINMSTKELGFDAYRLESATPAHSMYFPKGDIAHQGLLSALSISVGLDDGHAHPERILYIPMLTTTIKTTLPAKIVQYADQKGALDFNSNVVFANLVITSPSIDLDPEHLPTLIALVAQNSYSSSHPTKPREQPFGFLLLPKLNAKFSVHEPVFRIALPPVAQTNSKDDYDFDLLISSVSSIQMDLESSHSSSANENLRYAVLSTLRIVSHKLYYQTASRDTHDLLITESIDLKSQVIAAPELAVISSANVQNMSTYVTRPEIANGLRQIIQQLHGDVTPAKIRRPRKANNAKHLRALPVWLKRFDFQGTDFTFETAGLDQRISTDSRGVSLHLDVLTMEYKAKKDELKAKPMSRRRAGSQSNELDENILSAVTPSSGTRSAIADPTDGRRLAIHTRGLEAFVIETMNTLEQKPFMAIPRLEIALTTSSGNHVLVLHINSHIKRVHLEYSLFRHYAIGVAMDSIRQTLSPPTRTSGHSSAGARHSVRSPTLDSAGTSADHYLQPAAEVISVDVKIPFLQLKAQFPHDPCLMFHIEELDAGRHNHRPPFIRAGFFRVFADSPSIPEAWSRLFSMKSLAVEVHELRREHVNSPIENKAVDVSCEAIRFGIPHMLVLHNVVDNIVTTNKTIKQLHHRFKTGSDEYILAKHPEGPKFLPRVTIRSRILLFELEDGAFEWKLGLIYRTGLVEVRQRLARGEAFLAKIKKIKVPEVRPPNFRSRSKERARSLSRGRSADHVHHAQDRNSHRKRSSSEAGRGCQNIRYDKEGMCMFSSAAKATMDDAWEKLQRLNAQSWRMRIDGALKEQSGAVQDVRKLIWGFDSTSTEVCSDETILKIPQRPSLMSVLMSDLQVTIDRPSFPLAELPDFMYRVGKGLPKDTLFNLLIPLHARFDMGETRLALRDYPLPLLHIPSLRAGQSTRLPCWSLSTDFVIGEEYRDFESTRDLEIIVVPPEKMSPGQKVRGFAIDVRRTVAPVKMYADMKIVINTARDTHITWGTSYQPAIQDMMQVIEGFTKPPIDPSERIGFWDKIRLSFHSRVDVQWKGDGDVYLMLKGSRDPYVVTGHGGGLVMIWRNNVRWQLRADDDPTKFMTVDSGDYMLAVPDYSSYARRSPELGVNRGKEAKSTQAHNDGHLLKKVVMKLSGRVRWQAGIMFERDLEDGRRSFEFEPHYHVTLKNPVHVKSIKNQPSYDAYRGFRSNHIHLSIAVSAPSDRDWTKPHDAAAANYNSVHLSPRFFTHFFAWWHLFSGAMSLPVRQGPLFRGAERSGKKFGRHIATIKYSLLFSPIYISHVYKHQEEEEPDDDTVRATGLKVRLDSFLVDFHQRREEFHTDIKGKNKTVKTSGMRINQALVDYVRADLRAVSASISGTSLDAVRHASKEEVRVMSSEPAKVDLSVFTISDNDFSWIDADDFIEIDWSLPLGAEPDVKILPLAFAPRFTYRRQTDHGNTISGDPGRYSAFGNEPTHACIMSTYDHPTVVQINFVEERLERLGELMDAQRRKELDQELEAVKEMSNDAPEHKRLEELRRQGELLKQKKKFLNWMLRDLKRYLNPDGQPSEAVRESENDLRQTNTSTSGELNDLLAHGLDEGLDSNTMADNVSDFNNRFVVHNAQIKWNNSLRNCILRYFYQVQQRRGFVYYSSRRAVKFILDIIEEQNKAKKQTPSPEKESDTPPRPLTEDAELDIQARIQQLLDDGKKFVDADDPASADANRANRKASMGPDATDEVSHDFIAWNTYHTRLIAPQIQLQSEKNPKAVVLVTAKSMRLKVIQIMDKDRAYDEVSGLVQTRYAAGMERLQIFVTTKESLSPDFTNLFTGDMYGTSVGTAWPPWAPMESMYDFSADTYGFARVVQRTGASFRYDKYNQLRLKSNDNVTKEGSQKSPESDDAGSPMDELWVDFHEVRALCDSTQYFAIYIIVLDLLMWSEPLEKNRHERLEKIMLASDFSDLRGAPEMVEMLQNRIMQLEEIKTHFHVNEKYLDRQGWEDRISLEQDLASCEDELFFIMKAIMTAQRKNDERVEGAQANGVLRWSVAAKEIVWHLVKEAGIDLAEFQLGNAIYERIDNSDGSNNNRVEIDHIRGVSLLDNAIYPEIIAPYIAHHDGDAKHQHIKMLRVTWMKLEAIAGINVVDRFEVDLHPLQIQLDYETGRKLFDYGFPGSNNNDGHSSPFMVRNNLPLVQDESDEEVDAAARARREAIANASKTQAEGQDVGAGSLDSRLQPTHKLPERKPSRSSNQNQRSLVSKVLGLGIEGPDASQSSSFKFTSHSNKSTTSVTNSKAKARVSSDNTSLSSRLQYRHDAPSKTTTTESALSNESGSKSHRRFHLSRHKNRSPSADSRRSKSSKHVTISGKNGTGNANSDDLTKMLNRASNYMTLAYIKIPSVVLCLSYKGKGSRNFEDVHKLVFRIPTLEYRNKTWSNLDLALALKKDVIRALISHMGAIIGNKFIHHKPSKHTQSRLRELASSSVLLSSSNNVRTAHSTASSILGADSDHSDDEEDDDDTETVSRQSDVTDDLQEYQTPMSGHLHNGLLSMRPLSVIPSANSGAQNLPQRTSTLASLRASTSLLSPNSAAKQVSRTGSASSYSPPQPTQAYAQNGVTSNGQYQQQQQQQHASAGPIEMLRADADAMRQKFTRHFSGLRMPRRRGSHSAGEEVHDDSAVGVGNPTAGGGGGPTNRDASLSISTARSRSASVVGASGPGGPGPANGVVTTSAHVSGGGGAAAGGSGGSGSGNEGTGHASAGSGTTASASGGSAARPGSSSMGGGGGGAPGALKRGTGTLRKIFKDFG